MISEKNVASDFSGFWVECLPLLIPSFVRLFNEAYSENLKDLPQKGFIQIPIGKDVERHDLLAEFAFCLAEISHGSLEPVEEFRGDKQRIDMAFEMAVGFLKRYQKNLQDVVLSKSEIDEAFLIASQYRRFFEYLNADDILFRPKIRGAGFLGLCTADLSVGDTLYEVKTTARNLAGKDIKQLLVYLALQSSAGGTKWENAGFFNPRRALHYKFSIDHLIYRTSGGRSVTEVFQDIVDFLSSRDIEIDTNF